MVEKGPVADLHRLQMQGGGGVAHAGPFGAALGQQIIPTVAVGFGFEQPIGHRDFPSLNTG
jgi:hypothetical protein